MKSWSHIPQWAISAADALMQALKNRDPYTFGHCYRVARNAKLLAKAAGLNGTDQDIIAYSSIFHDLGKISIPDEILLKTSSLTKRERDIMEIHPVKSVEILQPLCKLPFVRSLIPGILHHHERIDGKGYPYGLTGSKIPLQAKIILIADTYDAMTSTRPYRKGRSAEYAYKELKIFAGRQFDFHLTNIFLKAHPTWGSMEEEISEEYISKHFKRAA